MPESVLSWNLFFGSFSGILSVSVIRKGEGFLWVANYEKGVYNQLMEVMEKFKYHGIRTQPGPVKR